MTEVREETTFPLKRSGQKMITVKPNKLALLISSMLSMHAIAAESEVMVVTASGSGDVVMNDIFASCCWAVVRFQI